MSALSYDRREIGAWIELDKALYEVEYEIDKRPAWHIPLLGILRIPGGAGLMGRCADA